MVDGKIDKLARNNRRVVFIIGIFFAVMAVVLTVSIFSQRETRGGVQKTDMHVVSLTCEGDNYVYPFFTYDEAQSKTLRIMGTFDDEKFRSLSLQQTLYYDSEQEVRKSEAENHATMNLLFQGDDLGADALGATYAIMGDGLRFGLYGLFEKIPAGAMKYFLLDKSGAYGLDELKNRYEDLGLECTTSEE